MIGITINQKKKIENRGIKDLNFRKKKNDEINYLDWFFKTFPGLKVKINK